MKTLCIVTCGDRKIWDRNPDAGPTKARFVYIGPFATKCREYAEEFYPSSWCILSAKHGFLLPNDIISRPYCVRFNKKGTNPITTKELSSQAKQKKLDDYQQIVVIGGKSYVDTAREVFSSKKILAPLTDCKGMGYMMRRLKEAVRRGVRL